MRLICLLVFVFVSIQVQARGGMGKCHQEAKSYCKDKNGPEMFKCMKENLSKLSPDCQAKIEEKKSKWQERHEACKEDKEKFCKETEPGAGRIVECMKQNMDKLSEPCKAQLNKNNSPMPANTEVKPQ